jgi:NADPH:quinone reductase-like Zn-dependent oxidoreductase
MHAAVVNDVTRPPTYAEFADPLVRDGRVEVQVVASAVHQIVRAIASGRHYSADLTPPFIPGVDGIIRLPDGRRYYVGGLEPPYGMLAERAAIPEGSGVPVPPGLDDGVAAAIVNPAASAWVPLTDLLRPDDTVLILGATGTSGLLAVQVAKLLGAGRVVAAGRNPEGLELALGRGADAAIRLDDDFGAALVGAADGYDIVLDYLWGDVATRALAGLVSRRIDPARPVHFVNLGGLAGPNIWLPASILRGAPVRLLGHGIGSGPMSRMPRAIAAILDAAAAGQLDIDISDHDLAEVEQVWDESGRLVLLP